MAAGGSTEVAEKMGLIISGGESTERVCYGAAATFVLWAGIAVRQYCTRVVEPNLTQRAPTGLS